jgi:hypothetical protein
MDASRKASAPLSERQAQRIPGRSTITMLVVCGIQMAQILENAISVGECFCVSRTSQSSTVSVSKYFHPELVGLNATGR